MTYKVGAPPTGAGTRGLYNQPARGEVQLLGEAAPHQWSVLAGGVRVCKSRHPITACSAPSGALGWHQCTSSGPFFVPAQEVEKQARYVGCTSCVSVRRQRCHRHRRRLQSALRILCERSAALANRTPRVSWRARHHLVFPTMAPARAALLLLVAAMAAYVCPRCRGQPCEPEGAWRRATTQIGARRHSRSPAP